jgi:hypothetical protein
MCLVLKSSWTIFNKNGVHYERCLSWTYLHIRHMDCIPCVPGGVWGRLSGARYVSH